MQECSGKLGHLDKLEFQLEGLHLRKMALMHFRSLGNLLSHKRCRHRIHSRHRQMLVLELELDRNHRRIHHHMVLVQVLRIRRHKVQVLRIRRRKGQVLRSHRHRRNHRHLRSHRHD